MKGNYFNDGLLGSVTPLLYLIYRVFLPLGHPPWGRLYRLIVMADNLNTFLVTGYVSGCTHFTMDEIQYTRVEIHNTITHNNKKHYQQLNLFLKGEKVNFPESTYISAQAKVVRKENKHQFHVIQYNVAPTRGGES